MRIPIPEAERPHCARFALVLGGIVVAWACLHDLYLIGIEPRHFTEYHRPLLPIANHALLAVQYAMVATVGPGLCFGFLGYAACRAGAREPVPLRHAAAGFAAVIAGVEVVLLALGGHARLRLARGEAPLYPEWAYPDSSPGIIVSQTVNISAYLIAPAAGALYLLARFLARRPRRATGTKA